MAEKRKVYAVDNFLTGAFVMKMLAASLFVMLVLVYTARVVAQDSMVQDNRKGSCLFHVCQGDVRTMDSPTGGETADLQLALHCTDYFGGFFDSIAIAGELGKPIFCLGNASIGTVVRVYVQFIQEHPKLLDEDREIGMYEFLKNSYPCSVSANPRPAAPSS